MNATKSLVCILAVGAALGAVAPAFADSEAGYYHERNRARYGAYDRPGHRHYGGEHRREYVHERVVMMPRPYIVAQPVYYPEPAPVVNAGLGAVIGAAIGGYLDSRP